MKKIFGIVLAVCLMATMLCVSVFAGEAPASDVVLRVSALKRDGSTVDLGDYKDHAEGWSAAMTIADDRDEMKRNDYDRIVVDLYADWTAVNGEFCNEGKGFNWDAIYFEDGVRMTLNLNGHTIDRALWTWQYNGEVMYIDKKADVIINDGTITGGWSCNGAGGIHINDKANVTLNNVNVMGNTVEDDEGGGIAVYDGATLIMNGGGLYGNNLMGTIEMYFSTPYGGGIYVEDSYLYLNGVTVANNNNLDDSIRGFGVGVCVMNSEVVIENCNFIENGRVDNGWGKAPAISVISMGGDDSVVTIRNTTFDGNGSRNTRNSNTPNSVIHGGNGELTIENCKFINNKATYLMRFTGVTLTVSDTDFTGNESLVLHGTIENTFTNCRFDKGVTDENFKYTFESISYAHKLNFIDCDLGDATFEYKNSVNVQNSLTGSIFSSGSFVMIVSFAALIASIASICVNVHTDKKRKDSSEILSDEE